MSLTSRWLTPTYNPLTKMLTSGSRIGSYEIVGSLGSGGMGEVYRARDLKLGREVALKILPDAFANNPDRLMRFEREAKTLASLNHPHIAQIFGLEDGPAEEGTNNRALVMELVEGEDLAQRIARGPIAVDEALPIARQIAEALEAAHDAGIIHRDLKPANIKVRPDATVKVLDFGLAKALESSAHTAVGHAGEGLANLANSPTITSPVGRLRGAGTEIGMILGTAAYMAPEQARGRAVDRRADIWAFGCVLYEMLTGHRAFAGDDLPETMTAIMRDTPAWDALPASTPDAVRDILERCLEKDPRTRLQAIGEARVALERALASTQSSVSRMRKRVESPPPTPVPSHAASKWTIGVVSALALCGVAAVTLVVVRSRLEPAVTGIFDIAAPARTSLNLVNRPAVSLSRDGSTLAFVARRQGVSRLYVRHRSEGQARALEGTDGANEPVISPNGQWIAFIADARLKRIAVGGGTASIVTEVNDARGLAWRDDNTIILSPGPVGGLAQVDAGGGSLKPLTTIDTAKGERTHRWPHVSSNGRFVLFTVATFHNPDNYETATIERLDLTTGQRVVVLSGARMARYVMDDVILFARVGELHAVRVDPNTGAVQGQSVLVVQGVNGDPTTGATHFAYGEDGTLAYVAGPAEVGRLRLMWIDYQGVARPTLDPSSVPLGYRDPKLSPDKRRVAATVFSGSAHDIWLYDLTRRTEMRFTFGALGGGPAGTAHVDNVTPVWSADGLYIYYASNSPDSTSSLFRKRADGSREPELVGRLSGVTYLKQVRERPDALLADLITVDRQSDIVLVGPGHDAASPPTNLVSTKADEGAGQLSPNGRWLAYQSDVGGRYDIYVRDIRGNGQWQISTAGGEEPRWSDDGRRLYFRSGTQMMCVEFAPGDTLDVTAAPSALFDGVHELRVESVATYDVDDTGQRFLVVSPAEDAERPEAIRVVLGWRSDLRRLLGLGSGRVF